MKRLDKALIALFLWKTGLGYGFRIWLRDIEVVLVGGIRKGMRKVVWLAREVIRFLFKLAPNQRNRIVEIPQAQQDRLHHRYHPYQ